MIVCNVERLIEEIKEQMYINVHFHNDRHLNEGLELAVKIIENQTTYDMEEQ